MANLRDKNDRAVVAFLKPVAAAVDPAAQVYPANYSGTRDLTSGIVDVITSRGPEDPPFSGNHYLNVRVRISYPAANQPEQANPQDNRVKLGKLVDAIDDALHQSDDNATYKYVARAITTAGNALATGDDAANNADMADYTAMFMRGVNYLGAPDEGEGAGTFVEIMEFQLYAAPLGGLN